MDQILIVPDCDTSADAPNISELRSLLERMDYDVRVFTTDKSPEESRWQLKHLCISKHFDMLVILGTGCLSAAKITNTPRIFVNPVW